MFGGGVIAMEPTSQPLKASSADKAAAADESIEQIIESLRGLRFGSVNIIVQDGVVIQIDRTEKRRLRSTKSSS
jgi:hypothetical protein